MYSFAFSDYTFFTQKIYLEQEMTRYIRMVDVKQKRMIWEGIAIGRVNEKETNTELRADINSGVKEMFTGEYPFRAGQKTN